MTLPMDDGAPLVDVGGARELVSVVPDLDLLNLAPDDPGTRRIWGSGTGDLACVLDELDAVEAHVPGLAGRSRDAETARTTAGEPVDHAARTPAGRTADPPARAAALPCLPGVGGADLTSRTAEDLAFPSPDVAGVKTASLLVAGGRDPWPMRGPGWSTGGYRLSSGPTDPPTLSGPDHELVASQGDDAKRTTDEGPERVAAIQQATLAHLWTAQGPDSDAWPAARGTLTATSGPLAGIDSP